MPRTKRNYSPGEVFHVVNRAVARPTIFEQPKDDGAFMCALAETWKIVALPTRLSRRWFLNSCHAKRNRDFPLFLCVVPRLVLMHRITESCTRNERAGFSLRGD